MLLHGPDGGHTALQCVPLHSNRPLGRGCRCAEAELGLWSRALQPAVGSLHQGTGAAITLASGHSGSTVSPVIVKLLTTERCEPPS